MKTTNMLKNSWKSQLEKKHLYNHRGVQCCRHTCSSDSIAVNFMRKSDSEMLDPLLGGIQRNFSIVKVHMIKRNIYRFYIWTCTKICPSYDTPTLFKFYANDELTICRMCDLKMSFVVTHYIWYTTYRYL